jgi:hypothetical protein
VIPTAGRLPCAVEAKLPPITQGDPMSKSQDSKKNVKKAPTKTPKEKKEAKRLKKAEKKY